MVRAVQGRLIVLQMTWKGILRRIPIGILASLIILLVSVYPAWGEEVLRGCYGIKTSSMVSGANAHNAVLAGEILHGTVVETGEIFSYNRTVGQRTTQRGFIAGLISSRSKQAVYSVGGGVCTTASILHQAVKSAGLEVLERHNHVSPTTYLPQGEDAAVWFGVEDYRFRNTLNNPIRIDAQTENGVLTIGIVELKPDYQEEDTIVMLNGHIMDIYPVLRFGDTFLLPVRDMVQALGGEIYWEPVQQQVLIKRGLSSIVLEISRDTAVIDEKNLQLECAVCLWKGQTMVPLSLLPEIFRVQVDLESHPSPIINLNYSGAEARDATIESAFLSNRWSLVRKAQLIEYLPVASPYQEDTAIW